MRNRAKKITKNTRNRIPIIARALVPFTPEPTVFAHIIRARVQSFGIPEYPFTHNVHAFYPSSATTEKGDNSSVLITNDLKAI